MEVGAPRFRQTILVNGIQLLQHFLGAILILLDLCLCHEEKVEGLHLRLLDLIQKTLLERISKLRAHIRHLESGENGANAIAEFGRLRSHQSVSPLTVDQGSHSLVSSRRSPGRGGADEDIRMDDRSPSHVRVHRSGSISVNSPQGRAYQASSSNPLSPSLIDLASNPMW